MNSFTCPRHYSISTLFLALALVCSAGARAETTEKSPASPDLLYLQALDQRIADISWRIGKANADLCREHMNAIGISVHDAVQYAPRYRAAAITTFGFQDGYPAVLTVASGAVADIAGVKVGDIVLAIDDQIVPAAPSDGKEDYRPVNAVMARLESLPADRPIALEVLRGKERLRLMLRPVQVCKSRVEVVPSGEINANSNGFVVQIYGKLALWTQNDDELAIVIAHEMAHNLLGHNRRIDTEKIGTGIFSGFGGDGRKLRDMEREADRYGLFLVARAGYHYGIAGQFWRRLSATTGLGAIWATTHPTARDRGQFNDAVIADIRQCIAEGRNPVP